MKRQKTQLLILGIMFILVIAAFLVIRAYNNHRAEKENTDTEPIYTVLNLTEAEVASLFIANDEGSFTVKKNTDETEATEWYSPENDTLMLDQDKISSLLNKVILLQADTRIENVSDMEQYGLENPIVTVTLTAQNGDNYRLLFGDYNETTSQYYFALDGVNDVYTLDFNLENSFRITLEDLKQAEDTEDNTAE